MNAFMRYRRNVSEGRCEDPDPLTAIDENIFRGTVRDIDDSSDIYGEVQDIYADNDILPEEEDISGPNSIAAASDDREDVLAQAITAPKYYKNEGSNIYIDDKSGNLRYVRNDISVPLSNGYMSLDLVYDVSEAKGQDMYMKMWTAA